MTTSVISSSLPHPPVLDAVKTQAPMSGEATMKMVILTILLGLVVPIARVSSAAADDKSDAMSETKNG